MSKNNIQAERLDCAPRMANSYGARLCVARQAKGLLVDQCAERLGVTAAQWGSWEAGRAVPDAVNGLLAAELLNVDPRWLALGD